MVLKKIREEMQDSSACAWLLEKEHHGLEDHDLSKVVRILINKHDELVEYIREKEQNI